ncbi:MAG: class I SAM-dependent methyltransferase [Chlamydiae bacterium]|nr:class I SAM-dependent methyltransferase [Chlamydiota bacterium]MBI3266198.1 class I SAM-dependent methyltransferase [Chlamydiota bacterium]
MNQKKPTQTHWDAVSKWYDQKVGKEGSEYHMEVLIPGLLQMLQPRKGEKILDLGCGQGVLCRTLAKEGVHMTGIDASPLLIESAKRYPEGKNLIHYQAHEAQSLKGIPDTCFDAVVSLLAIQNMNPLESVMKEVTRVVKKRGHLLWVLNHPCFRIPKASHWGFDEEEKIQYRRVDRYLSLMKVPIQMHPGEKPDVVTWSFHRPLSFYFELFASFGWAVTGLEEWTSHKKSEPGPRAKAEDRARLEIPLFLAIGAEKS